MAKAASTGFDPSVVTKFFSTLAEFRDEIKDSRQELKEVRKALADLQAVIAAQTEKLKSITDWQTNKSQECLRHQAQTAVVHDELNALRNEMERSKGTTAGLGLAWKIVAGAALLISTVTGVLVALSKL